MNGGNRVKSTAKKNGRLIVATVYFLLATGAGCTGIFVSDEPLRWALFAALSTLALGTIFVMWVANNPDRLTLLASEKPLPQATQLYDRGIVSTYSLMGIPLTAESDIGYVLPEFRNDQAEKGFT